MCVVHVCISRTCTTGQQPVVTGPHGPQRVHRPSQGPPRLQPFQVPTGPVSLGPSPSPAPKASLQIGYLTTIYSLSGTAPRQRSTIWTKQVWAPQTPGPCAPVISERFRQRYNLFMIFRAFFLTKSILCIAKQYNNDQPSR